MTLNEARSAIYSRFISSWGTTTVYCFGDEPFDPPEDDEWVRLSVKSLPSNQSSLGVEGNRRFLRHGIIFVQIFVPNRSGASRADALSKLVLDMFEAKRFAGIWTFTTDIDEQFADGKLISCLAQTQFHYEDIK